MNLTFIHLKESREPITPNRDAVRYGASVKCAVYSTQCMRWKMGNGDNLWHNKTKHTQKTPNWLNELIAATTIEE